MIRQYVYFGIALLVAFLFLFLNKKFFRWLQRKVGNLENNIFFGRNKFAQFFRFITPRRERHILTFVLRVLKILVVFTFFVLYLPLLFSFVPQTKKYADVVLGWIKTPLFMQIGQGQLLIC